MAELARDNHFVPQAYLRNWSSDGLRVWAYDILGPHPDYPAWASRPIKRLAAHEDLYTSVRTGTDSDEFERWMNQEIEIPGIRALQKAVADVPLSKDEWRALVRLAAAQDLRTPTSYVQQTRRWADTLPDLLQKTLSDAKRKLAEAAKTGKKLSDEQDSSVRPVPSLRLRREPGRTDGEVLLRAEVTAGRDLWLHSLYHALTQTVRVLYEHQWRVLRPWHGMEWFTSDHPVLRLNYYGNQPGVEREYDFGGGWGNNGSEFIFPLSPQHLLYARVANASPPDPMLSSTQTRLIQRFLAERARRWVFASKRTRRVEWFRPRVIDEGAFKAEDRAWRQWHAEQTRAHRDVPDDGAHSDTPGGAIFFPSSQLDSP